MRHLFSILLILLCCPVATYADAVGYGGVHKISVKRGSLTFSHAQNWDSKKVEALFSDLQHHEKFFSSENDFSSVEVRHGSTTLFHSPSPALTYLWISPDGQFFVGLSDIMLRNPYQLVVWQRNGTIIHYEHISAFVAKFTPEQRNEFAKRFPEAERILSGRYFTLNGATYLDFDILGVPNQIGDKAFYYLLDYRVRHPYSDDFSESVTNWVGWFDENKPELNIDNTNDEIKLSLRSPTGKRFSITIKEKHSKH